MELTPRKQAVLKAIVKAYIETGEPVGSKNLVSLLESAPSAATLRNEMSELCELGLLCQPHTSAGRVPTSSGYRFYVDSLSQNSLPQKEITALIDSSLKSATCEADGIPEIAAKTLSRITRLPAISCLLTEKPPSIKQVELLNINRFSVMLLIITDDGRTRNRIFRNTNGLTAEQKMLFKSIVGRRINGKYINLLTKAYLQSIIAEAGLHSLELMPLISAVFETATEIEDTCVTLSGENALYNLCSDENIAGRIISLIKQRDPIISILKNTNDNVSAVFGADTGYTELKDNTVISAKFKGADKYQGYIGIIGPNRMSYEHIMPVIEYTAKQLTDIMTQAQKDMED